MDCYRHPATGSTATCVACDQPICEECREEVAGHAMCKPCVAATQARLSQQEAPAVAAGVTPTAGLGVVPGAETVYGRPPSLGRRILRGMLWGIPYGQWW